MFVCDCCFFLTCVFCISVFSASGGFPVHRGKSQVETTNNFSSEAPSLKLEPDKKIAMISTFETLNTYRSHIQQQLTKNIEHS